MAVPSKHWKVQDNGKLLLARMNELSGDAHISFEGDLTGLTLSNIPGASREPRPPLERNTLWPKQDFVIVPLQPSTRERIIAAIGGTVPRHIIHIQIEKDGVLQFGAYDNFHPECIYFGTGVESELLDFLISEGVLKPHAKTRPKPKGKS